MESVHRANPFLVTGLLSLALFVNCADGQDPGRPDNGASPFPAPVSPGNLALALRAIYNDALHSAAQRSTWYEDLLVPADHHSLPPFTFYFSEQDVQMGSPMSWGLSDELAATRAVFTRQESGDISSLSLDFKYEVLQPPDLPPGHEDWRVVSLSAVTVRVVTAAQSSTALGAAALVAAPADGCWYVVHWHDDTNRGDPTFSWGGLKAHHLP